MPTFSISTNSPASITDVSAVLEGSIDTFDKSLADAICCFFIWGTNSDLSNSSRTAFSKDVAIFTDGGGLYTIEITGLSASTTYYYKAKARVVRYDDETSMEYVAQSLGFLDLLVQNSTELGAVLDVDVGTWELLKSSYVEDTLYTYSSPSEQFFNDWNWVDLSSGEPKIEREFDLTDVSTITAHLYCTGDIGHYFEFKIDDSQVKQTDVISTSTFVERSIDVSGYTGVHKLGIGVYNASGTWGSGFASGPTGNGSAVQFTESGYSIDARIGNVIFA